MRGFYPLLLLTAVGLALRPTTAAQAQTVTRIGTIQGSGAAATAGTFTIEGIVTATYPGWAPAGFYVQETTAEADPDPATSNAIYVIQAAATVAPGDRVRVTGLVAESTRAPSNGQAVITAPIITVLATGQPLPAFTPLDNTTFSLTDAEALEGMLIQFDSPVTVTDVGAIKSRGELTISPRGLVYQPTQQVDPNDDPATGTTSTGASNVAAVNAYDAANDAKILLLDDGRAVNGPQPVPYFDPQTQTVRVGATIDPLRGILGYGSNRWRVQPLAGAAAPVVRSPRPAVPTFSATTDVRLASFNVLNYFNGNGAGGGFPTPRGATTADDFARQRAKILLALRQLDADAVGLMEIENDGTGAVSAIQDLVDGLNQATAPGTWAFINDGGNVQTYSSDLIRCAIIYQPARVTPVGPAILSNLAVFDRPPLAQRFVAATAPADTFALVVNHFKSKASGSGLDADQGDGQGRSNNRRRLQAQGLVQFLQQALVGPGTTRVVSVGDYNANYEEDPLDVLRAAGLTVAAPASSISYVFSGLSGSLDHAIITPALVGQAEVHKWNINSQEPYFLEYDVAGPATDTTNPYRSSDHDPLVIGLRFTGFPPTGVAAAANSTASFNLFPNPATDGFQLSLPTPSTTASLELTVVSAVGQTLLTLRGSAAALATEVPAHTARLAPGVYWVRVRGAGLDQTRRVVKE
jgi:predicted extracellular nuclease